MFRVEKHPQGFIVRIGDGKRGGYHAYSADEVALAVRHYFDRPGNERHKPLVGASDNPNCPLCRINGGSTTVNL